MPIINNTKPSRSHSSSSSPIDEYFSSREQVASDFHSSQTIMTTDNDNPILEKENDGDEEEEEEQLFREPSGGFKDILSRWNQKAAEHQVHLSSNHIAGQAHRLTRCRSNESNKKLNDSSTHSLQNKSDHSRRSRQTDGPSKTSVMPASTSTTTPTATVNCEEKLDGSSSHESKQNNASEGTTENKRTKPGRLANRIDIFNKTSAPPFKIATKKLAKPTTNLSKAAVTPSESSATAPDSPSKLSPKGKALPTAATTTSKDNNSTENTGASPSARSRNWTKLKAAGLAARATIKLQHARDRIPKNIYQKPLHTRADFRPPKFAHSPAELTVIRKALKKNFVFGDLNDKELQPLMDAFEKCSFKANENIITQGSRGDFFYIIFDGKVAFNVNGKIVGKAGKGNSFGELALLYTCPRAATVTAQRDTILFRVDQATFRYILQHQTKESEKEKVTLLRGVNFLSELSSVDLEKLANVMTPRVFSPKDLLVKKGEMGDHFYVLQEGEVLITDISVGSTTYADQKLGPKEYFGERSLMTSEPRAANVVALTYGVAFSIDRSSFQKVLGQMSDVILRAQDSRKLAGVPLLQAAQLSMMQFLAMAQVMTDSCYRRGKTILRKNDLTTPALYFVREGKVNVEIKGKTKEISAGGFFGEELMEIGVRKHLPNVPSPMTVTCTEKATLAELRLAKCRSIFDVQLLAGRSSEAFSLGEIEDDDDDEEDEFVKRLKEKRELEEEFRPRRRPKVKLENLDKIKLLGAGTFGQVWLVTDKSKRKEKVAYALKVQVSMERFCLWCFPSSHK